MPVAGLGGRGVFRLTGGARLQRLLTAVNNPRLMTALGARALRRHVLPELKTVVPVRTGALRNGLKFEQEGLAVYLRSTDYARYVRWGRGRKTVAGEAHRIFQKNRRLIKKDIASGLRRAAG